MINRPRINRLGIILLVVHLVVIFWITMQEFEGSWGGFLIFLIDFPVSVLSFAFSGYVQFIYFMAVVGSMWWYLIGLAISTLIKRAESGEEPALEK
jgi:hypothetical protein